MQVYPHGRPDAITYLDSKSGAAGLVQIDSGTGMTPSVLDQNSVCSGPGPSAN